MATSRRTALVLRPHLGLPQSSAILVRADPEEAGTALAPSIRKIVRDFKLFRPATGSAPVVAGFCDKMASRESANEQNDGKIVEEDCVCLPAALPRNGHDALQ
jgi:hypothetical protein